jgi:hypothetical protein
MDMAIADRTQGRCPGLLWELSRESSQSRGREERGGSVGERGMGRRILQAADAAALKVGLIEADEAGNRVSRASGECWTSRPIATSEAEQSSSDDNGRMV